MDLDIESIMQACDISESQDAVTFLGGSVIFREGDRGDCAYIIETGEVRIVRDVAGQLVDIARLGPGDLLGEMAPIDDQRRSATAVASGEVRLTPIPRSSIEALVESADPMLRLLIRLLMQRMREQTEGTVQGTGERSLLGEGAQVEGHGADAVTAALETVREQALSRIRARREITDALHRRELVLHLQPIVHIGRWEPCGYEALVRWAHPQRGLISPGGFIPAAEKYGLIQPIGQWCMRSACEIAQMILGAGGAGGARFVSVNVSPEQLRTLDDIERLLGTVRDSGVDPSHIKVEVTEHLLIDDPDVAIRGLKRIRDAGMSVAIDDFGTGYSSLSYLHRFPLDTLKLDRSFIDGLAGCEKRLAVVEAIVRLAERLSMDVVAEGIERVDDLRTLAGLGVHRIQGYLLGKPMPVDKVPGWSVRVDRDDALGRPRSAPALNVA